MMATAFSKNYAVAPPYWKKAQKDLFTMILMLCPATLFITVSAAETRWIHLLKILSKIVDKVELTDEQCHQLSWLEK